MDGPEALIDGFVSAFNAHDADAFGRLFAEDADWVSVVGIRVTGRRDIQDEHADAFRKYFSEATLTATDHTVRSLGPDLAVVHFTWALTGEGEDEHDSEREPRRGIIVIVAARESKGWRIKVGQNTNSFVPAS